MGYFDIKGNPWCRIAEIADKGGKNFHTYSHRHLTDILRCPAPKGNRHRRDSTPSIPHYAHGDRNLHAHRASILCQKICAGVGGIYREGSTVPVRRFSPWTWLIIKKRARRKSPCRLICTQQLHKTYSKRQLGVLVNLYSGTFYRFITAFPRTLQKSPQVISHVTHKT